MNQQANESTKSADDIKNWMTDKIAEAMGVAPGEIDSAAPFTSYGLDSIVVFTMTGDLADWLGCELPATLLWEEPTIDSLSSKIAQEIKAA